MKYITISSELQETIDCFIQKAVENRVNSDFDPRSLFPEDYYPDAPAGFDLLGNTNLLSKRDPFLIDLSKYETDEFAIIQDGHFVHYQIFNVDNYLNKIETLIENEIYDIEKLDAQNLYEIASKIINSDSFAPDKDDEYDFPIFSESLRKVTSSNGVDVFLRFGLEDHGQAGFVFEDSFDFAFSMEELFNDIQDIINESFVFPFSTNEEKESFVLSKLQKHEKFSI